MNLESSSTEKKVVLTCAQPTGKLHLGNYLGAVKNWVEITNEYECYFGIADMHAITMPYVPSNLRKNTYDCLAQYLACGLDPSSSCLFAQSQVTGHAELAWILSCICPLGQLERMTQFKDKSSKLDSIGAGLLNYPTLMAADILLYNADLVPVGIDQKQHLELTRDLAGKFNQTYSDTFKLPEPFLPKVGAKIMSLQNPLAKMSKSDKNAASTIYITDSADVISKKIGSAITDSGSEIKANVEGKEGINNLISIMSACSNLTVEQIEKEFENKKYSDFKKAVAQSVIEKLSPVREKYAQLSSDKKYLDEVLKQGAQNAQKRAYKILSKVYRKVGFVERAR